MATIQVQVSRDDLLRAIRQLDTAEFSGLVSDVLSLRAQRTAPVLSADEATLLQHINQRLPEEAQQRRAELQARLAAETLTAEEHAALVQLNAAAEQLNAQRIEALTQLAGLRRVSLRQVMQDLGLVSGAYA